MYFHQVLFLIELNHTTKSVCNASSGISDQNSSCILLIVFFRLET